MGDLWRNRALIGQMIVLAIAGLLCVQQLRILGRMEAAEQALTNPQSPSQVRPLYMERVFSFPENTCGPNPLPVFQSNPAARAQKQAASLTGLAREQFQYGLMLSTCMLGGLLMGITLTYRAAQRESRTARAKSSFVSNISHEMKTPLATIRMFSETLESGRIQDARKLSEYHKIIHSETLRLGQMVEDVLDFARLENQSRQFHFATTDVSALLSAASVPFERQLEHSGGKLTLDVSPALPMAEIDAGAISQAVQNLLSNAIKYSPERREIRLSAWTEGRHLGIAVEDHGIGIPAEEQGRIFEKFYRVESGLTHSTKGTGLGLAIVQQIVEAHKGRVQVESKPGLGSRFTVLLPISASRQLPWVIHEPARAETADRRG